jgi:hypothetical protein
MMSTVSKRQKYFKSDLTISGNLRAEFWRLPPEAMVDRRTIAAVLYVSVPTTEDFATKGGGPKYIRIGRKALYRKSDGLSWAAATGRELQSTSQLERIAPLIFSEAVVLEKTDADKIDKNDRSGLIADEVLKSKNKVKKIRVAL